jgi:tetratricopeptide (TPR) repeat protein
VRSLFGTLVLVASSALWAQLLLAQRAKPVIDPETKDGLLIEHIIQERDPAEKLHYLEQFAAQYPSHAAIAWVYDQLQPAYFEVKEYDQAMRIGALRLAIEPDNIDAAKIALRSAEGKKDPAEMTKWGDRLWLMSADGAAKSPADTKQPSEARQNQDYAEFCMYTAATLATDPQVKLASFQKLETRNPATRFEANFPLEYFRIYREMGEQERTIQMAEQGLRIEPDNIDMLLVLAEYHSHRDGPKERQVALNYATQLIQSAEKKDRPANVSEEEWVRKKAQALGTGNYVGGMAFSLNASYKQADQMLRQALNYVKDNEAQLAALLYHLGMANYRLAEAGGDRSRPVDALRFMRRCAALPGPYQQQAVKNVEGIRAEYNLP